MPQNVSSSSSHQQLEGQLVTVFGGGGFVGRAVAQALMQAGARVRIAQRNPRHALAVRALGNLGQTQFVAADVRRRETLARALHGSDAVVNLVGSFSDMEAVQAVGAGNVAMAAKAAGARAFVQMSAIGADAASPSAYGRSKAAGEAAVAAAFGEATILRPSIIFGRDDAFINRFAGLMSMAPVMPVFAPETLFQPVFVGDVAQAVVAALTDGNAQGQRYELGGPQQFSMRALQEWIASQIGRHPVFINVPDVVAGGIATATGWLPGAPITRDQWAMLGSDNVVAKGAHTLSDLGIAATALQAVAPGWLDQYRRAGRFSAASAA